VEHALTAVILILLGSIRPALWPALDRRYSLIGFGLLLVIRPVVGCRSRRSNNPHISVLMTDCICSASGITPRDPDFARCCNVFSQDVQGLPPATSMSSIASWSGLSFRP